MKTTNENDIVLVSYPRSGNNYFTANYNNIAINHKITFSHDHLDIFKNKNVITIVRDPVECVSSLISLYLHNSNKTLSEKELSEMIDLGLLKYMKIINTALLKEDVTMLDFNDVVNNFTDIAIFLKNKYNKEYKIDSFSKDFFINNRVLPIVGVLPFGDTSKFLHTSKNLKTYDYIKYKIMIHPKLIEYKDLYQKALKKTVVVNDNDKINGHDILIATYPRSGSTFFRHYFFKSTNLSINKTHKDILNNDYKYVFTIIREPISSITSAYVMSNHYDPQLNNSEDQKIEWQKRYYINFYNELLSIEDMVFLNFKDLDKIEILASKVANDLNIKNFKNIDSKFVDVRDKPSHQFLKSSKKITDYDRILEKVKLLNLDECFDLYNKALDKCIKI
jgi:hypothetical protein